MSRRAAIKAQLELAADACRLEDVATKEAEEATRRRTERAEEKARVEAKAAEAERVKAEAERRKKAEAKRRIEEKNLASTFGTSGEAVPTPVNEPTEDGSTCGAPALTADHEDGTDNRTETEHVI